METVGIIGIRTGKRGYTGIKEKNMETIILGVKDLGFRGYKFQ